MNSESQVVAEVWDLVRDCIPTTRRLEIAISLLRTFEEYGFDARDMQDIVDEDPHLARAYADIFEEEEDEDEKEEESDYED